MLKNSKASSINAMYVWLTYSLEVKKGQAILHKGMLISA